MLFEARSGGLAMKFSQVLFDARSGGPRSGGPVEGKEWGT